MSSPGFFMDDADYAKQRMAMALMGQHGAQGNNSGLANAGGAIGGAVALKALQDKASGQPFMRDRMAAAGTPMASPFSLGNLFSLGGS
jgi:hypothetical protein